VSTALPTKLARALRPEDVGALVSFKVADDVNHEGTQIGLAGSGAGTLLGFFRNTDARGGYISMAIEGYSHHIAIGPDDEIVIHT